MRDWIGHVALVAFVGCATTGDAPPETSSEIERATSRWMRCEDFLVTARCAESARAKLSSRIGWIRAGSTPVYPDEPKENLVERLSVELCLDELAAEYRVLPMTAQRDWLRERGCPHEDLPAPAPTWRKARPVGAAR